jgi:chemotaxis protein MotB
MSEETKDTPHELVIIKRRLGGHEDGHHGGVWKIAYADFMTAMMAFFLVMWLINAANEETRAQVASYFNPVRLIDSRTNTKGLQDLESGAEGKVTQEPVTGKVKSKTDKNSVDKPEDKTIKEEELFQDPYKVLTEIGGPVNQPVSQQPDTQESLGGGSGKPGQNGGEAYLDPFDPQSWDRTQERGKSEIADKVEGEKAEAGAKSDLQANKPDEGKAKIATPEDQAAFTEEGPADIKPDDKAKTPEAKAEEIRKEIAKAIGEDDPGAAPVIEVKSTDNGVLISLTDDAHFGMFAIASAKPEPVLVRYLAEIGKILEKRGGLVTVSGHTDGRPFRSDKYDNWRLSAARAHMAYYMLVRGGLEEKRVEKIEGHADRNLKVPGDPENAQNRRIEIYIREAKT